MEYRMNVNLFGATSSPSCANFALRRCAEDNKEVFSDKVVNTILHNFYVDDCLASVATEEEAVSLYHDLKAICYNGGFLLTKWISNSHVLAAIPEEQRVKEVKDLDHDQLPVERVLGVQWCVQSDTFKFKITFQDKPPTRRGILSTVSSIYDPLGILAPVVLSTKKILQDLCRKELGWDDTVPTTIAQEWRSWMHELCQLKDFKVDRCLKPAEFGEITSAQLHHFADAKISPEDPEVKRSVTVNTIQTEVEDVDAVDTVTRMINYFSSWIRLRRVVCWILRLKNLLLCLSRKRKQKSLELAQSGIDETQQKQFLEKEIQNIKAQGNGGCLSIEELRKAELEIIRFCQKRRFPAEFSSLEKDGAVKSSSHIYKLNLVLKDGVLRVGGRLSRATMPKDSKHPVVLTKDLHISDIILRHIHHKVGHGGRNHMLSTLRQSCVLLQGASRWQTYLRIEFPRTNLHSHVGVDYFGPFERYGVLFTCLSIRAVHIEVASSLDTDSFINALRRFIARRGQVSELHSDNGTKFVGAERELKEAIGNWNLSQIHDTLLQKEIKFVEGLCGVACGRTNPATKLFFNPPPSGSHHGGVWERLIRSVRKVLNSTLKVQCLDEESLHTVLCEVEAIINGRPITKASTDPNDLEALTPNHLLLLKTKPSLPPGQLQKEDIYARCRWRQVQYISNLFWKRWIAEYLPQLQERQKWSGVKRNFIPGDIVIIVDDSAPRNSWLTGRIIQTIPDRRGLVRLVRIKTKTSCLDRPITKVCLLQEAEES
ncbi:hypothetical protein N1851_013933 [Merluccius polli]|uniref:DUF5641 domain-containing protein n=1 Tax=Merluccius polli TaxID=89951 RepID=A0AA47MV55_MERPO|nr:hypothetical protein N1851_013933 [Merluccius polli]